jgi:hypothetical protein
VRRACTASASSRESWPCVQVKQHNEPRYPIRLYGERKSSCNRKHKMHSPDSAIIVYIVLGLTKVLILRPQQAPVTGHQHYRMLDSDWRIVDVASLKVGTLALQWCFCKSSCAGTRDVCYEFLRRLGQRYCPRRPYCDPGWLVAWTRTRASTHCNM